MMLMYIRASFTLHVSVSHVLLTLFPPSLLLSDFPHADGALHVQVHDTGIIHAKFLYDRVRVVTADRKACCRDVTEIIQHYCL